MARDHALIIEGGGMKGAFANGVLAEWEESGYRPWSAVYGSSAGGALAAWMSANQAVYAQETWKYAQDPRILSYRRWMTRQGPILDHDALLRIVYEDEHPLDVAAVHKARFPVVVTAADVHSGRCVYQDIRGGPVIDWLRATGRLPMASGEPVTIGGRSYLDGGIVDPIPIEYALAQGHDEVTVIFNNRYDAPKREPPLLPELIARRYPRLRDGLTRHQTIKWQSAQRVLRAGDGAKINVVRPAKVLPIGRLSRDLDGINDALRQGRHAGRDYLRSAAA